MLVYFYRYKTLRTAGNKLVVNLAIANFIMHSKSWVLIVNGIAGGPILGELGMYYSTANLIFDENIRSPKRLHFLWRLWHNVWFVRDLDNYKHSVRAVHSYQYTFDKC